MATPSSIRVAGADVPYPVPTSGAATARGRANRRVDTRPERRVRSAVHGRGFRYRKDFLIKLDTLRAKPDLAFTRARVAVFVDGCFWHCCPEHGNSPARNRDYWGPKLEANVERDRRVDNALAAHGWAVVRVWEHDDPEAAADRIVAVVDERRRQTNRS